MSDVFNDDFDESSWLMIVKLSDQYLDALDSQPQSTVSDVQTPHEANHISTPVTESGGVDPLN